MSVAPIRIEALRNFVRVQLLDFGVPQEYVNIVDEAIASCAVQEVYIPTTRMKRPAEEQVKETDFLALEIGGSHKYPAAIFNYQTVACAVSRFSKKHAPRRYRLRSHSRNLIVQRLVDDDPEFREFRVDRLLGRVAPKSSLVEEMVRKADEYENSPEYRERAKKTEEAIRKNLEQQQKQKKSPHA